MPDFPHRGPNISRIRLEGAGGFIYALTPVLILLLGAPLVLAGAVAAGAAIAPLIHWRHQSHPRAWIQTLSTTLTFLLGLLVTLQVGNNGLFRALAVSCVLGGIVAAVLIGWRWGGSSPRASEIIGTVEDRAPLHAHLERQGRAKDR